MPNGFNRLSRFYDAMLWLTSGNSILKSQTALLSALSGAKSVLMIGGGTGSFLVELLRHKKVESVCYVDISQGMIEVATRKLQKELPGQFSKVRFVCGTVEAIDPGEKFEVVVTNYVLDLFEPAELKSLMNKIDQHLSAGGNWYVTDFSYSEKSGVVKSSIHKILYIFFRFVCGISGTHIPDLKSEMAGMGMKLKAEQYFLKKLLWSAVYTR